MSALAISEARFECGWMRNYLDDRPAGYMAFLRPYSENWYELRPCDTWWEALAVALEIEGTQPNCTFVGGPDNALPH